MMAALGMLRIVPSWCCWILALVALCLGCEIHGAGRVQAKWDAQVKQQAAAAEAALEVRREQNRATGAEQALKAAQIQKGHDDEMAKVRSDLRNSERLRLGAAWCDGFTPGPAQAGGTGGSNAANAPGRILSSELDRAVKSLIEQAEEAAAAARAAQAFIRENGMPPP
ncbi:hypothetical protein J2X56_001582 [Herbaspirillum sp. 1173]|uniref:hypothetical protein n=1 Tax=Herbaspirillum sp. 1173 TaxID=2817734 RepID=UPI002859B7D4|nr:hypothetical protein [Herbaspirillum sp. 1173]MDR6739568.1 hypothetical protein [Herbaspirillum sp. 1173]